MLSKALLGFYLATAIAGTHSGSYLNEIASIIGVDVPTLTTNLSGGKSLVDIAQSQGISEQALITNLQGRLKVRLRQAVTNGKLSIEKEAQIISTSSERFQKLVEHKGLFNRGEGMDA